MEVRTPVSIHREPAPGAESTQSGNKCDLGEYRALGVRVNTGLYRRLLSGGLPSGGRGYPGECPLG